MTDNEFDHPFGDLDDRDRDPSDQELNVLDDHELAELYRDLARGSGTLDLYDEVTRRMVRRFDEYEAEGRLNDEG